MSYKYKILLFVSKKIILKNQQFKNSHKGESCYLIGNGSSIKYYDLKQFDNKVVIGCNGLFLHSDFSKINVRYYYTGHPFMYYPFWRNSYTKKIEKNTLGSIYKRKVRQNSNMILFTSLSNYFGLNGKNKFYFHHFGNKFHTFDNSKLDANFSSVADAISGMLGVAIFMGFEKITLIGCDYAFFPQSIGHFFDYGRFPDTYDKKPNNEKIYRAAQKYAEIRVVTPYEDYKGHILPHISYEELTGKVIDYKENYEIVSEDDLTLLNLVNFPYLIYPKDEA